MRSGSSSRRLGDSQIAVLEQHSKRVESFIVSGFNENES
jgi:hypothetical protein